MAFSRGIEISDAIVMPILISSFGSAIMFLGDGKVAVIKTKKKERGFLVLFLCFVPCFNENEYSDYYENEARYAFNVVGRQWYARLVPSYQYGIDKQDCSEH